MEPEKIAIVVLRGSGLKGKKPGSKFLVVFGIGKQRYSTEPSGNEQGDATWNTRAEVDVHNVREEAFFKLKEEKGKHTLSEISVSIADLPDKMPTEAQTLQLKSSKTNEPVGSVQVKLYVSSYRQVSSHLAIGASDKHSASLSVDALARSKKSHEDLKGSQNSLSTKGSGLFGFLHRSKGASRENVNKEPTGSTHASMESLASIGATPKIGQRFGSDRNSGIGPYGQSQADSGSMEGPSPAGTLRKRGSRPPSLRSGSSALPDIPDVGFDPNRPAFHPTGMLESDEVNENRGGSIIKDPNGLIRTAAFNDATRVEQSSSSTITLSSSQSQASHPSQSVNLPRKGIADGETNSTAVNGGFQRRNMSMRRGQRDAHQRSLRGEHPPITGGTGNATSAGSNPFEFDSSDEESAKAKAQTTNPESGQAKSGTSQNTSLNQPVVPTIAVLASTARSSPNSNVQGHSTTNTRVSTNPFEAEVSPTQATLISVASNPSAAQNATPAKVQSSVSSSNTNTMPTPSPIIQASTPGYTPVAPSTPTFARMGSQRRRALHDNSASSYVPSFANPNATSNSVKVEKVEKIPSIQPSVFVSHVKTPGSSSVTGTGGSETGEATSPPPMGSIPSGQKTTLPMGRPPRAPTNVAVVTPQPSSDTESKKETQRPLVPASDRAPTSRRESVAISSTGASVSNASSISHDVKQLILEEPSRANSPPVASKEPVIENVSPTQADAEGGTKITIRGKNLGTSAADIISLKVCGSNCLSELEYVSSEELRFKTRKWKECSGYITIDTKNGGCTSPSTFYFVEQRHPRASISLTPSNPLPSEKLQGAEIKTQVQGDLGKPENLKPDTTPINSEKPVIAAPVIGRSSPQSRLVIAPTAILREEKIANVPTDDTDKAAILLRKNYADAVKANELLRTEVSTLRSENDTLRKYLDRILERVVDRCPDVLCINPNQSSSPSKRRSDTSPTRSVAAPASQSARNALLGFFGQGSSAPFSPSSSLNASYSNR